ncbi:MAG: F0F1 ATP synthase subunit A [Tannerella sp.]|jgi:F-type H+-transporting ATPase subunit a|nr:F0F1 ATP synthase subunit A [Tannerella sp.]
MKWNIIFKYIAISLLLTAFAVNRSTASDVVAGADAQPQAASDDIKIKDLIFEHIEDTYWWHITTINEHHLSVYLPVIVISKTSGLNVFMSSHLEHSEGYRGFRIAESGDNKGKIVEFDAAGREVRPIDLSITKIAFALIFNSVVMLLIFLSAARWYRRHPRHAAPGGFTGAIEMFVMSVEDDIIKKCIGKDYALYSPYLLTAFFFIFINNIIGLIPFFPGGANVTGNISITLVLALCTMLVTNLTGKREYWKEIFWPHVPLWMKAPIPFMPLIEFFGVFSKPFALTIRLFANITAGHAIAISLTCIIFVTAKMGVATHTGMSAFAIVLAVFMGLLEILVAYLQAYVFTMLSAVFIGLARAETPHHEKKGKEKLLTS